MNCRLNLLGLAHQVSGIAASRSLTKNCFLYEVVKTCSQQVSSCNLLFKDCTVNYKLNKIPSHLNLFLELVLSSWIHKSSSLPFLSRFDAGMTQFRPPLLLRDFNSQHELRSQESEPNTAVCDVQDSNRLTSSEKKSLITKRLIPLIISLLILGAAVAIRLLVPLPSSHDTASVSNDTLGFNMTSNSTRNR